MTEKPKLLKRNLKLRELRYHIDGTDTTRPRNEVLTAIGIGFFMALAVFVFGLAFISEIIN